jgi:hypothetical protein
MTHSRSVTNNTTAKAIADILVAANIPAHPFYPGLKRIREAETRDQYLTAVKDVAAQMLDEMDAVS